MDNTYYLNVEYTVDTVYFYGDSIPCSQLFSGVKLEWKKKSKNKE